MNEGHTEPLYWDPEVKGVDILPLLLFTTLVTDREVLTSYVQFDTVMIDNINVSTNVFNGVGHKFYLGTPSKK